MTLSALRPATWSSRRSATDPGPFRSTFGLRREYSLQQGWIDPLGFAWSRDGSKSSHSLTVISGFGPYPFEGIAAAPSALWREEEPRGKEQEQQR